MARFPLALCLLALPLAAQDEKSAVKKTVLVELYTSQGWSTCPGADALLGDVKGLGVDADRVVALALHVDYWDYIGWKDTFGSKDHTARQKAYLKKITDDPYYKKGSIYTPNLVIDGGSSCGGTSKAAATKAIKSAQAEAAHVELDAAAKLSDGKVKVTVGGRNVTEMNYPATLQLRAVVVESGLKVDIGAGELKGKSVTYDNAARRWAAPVQYEGEIGKRKAFSVEIAVEKEWIAENLAVVLFVQDSETLKVWQAARVKIAK